MPKAKGTRGGGKKQGPRWAYVEPRNTSPTRVEMHIAIARIAPSENPYRSREDSLAAWRVSQGNPVTPAKAPSPNMSALMGALR